MNPLFQYKVDYKWIDSRDDEGLQFDLNDPAQRKLYFNHKVGDEIERLKTYMQNSSFIAYLLAPKQAGKGTYTKILSEIFGDLIAHISVGDVVRAAHEQFEAEGKDSEIYKYAVANYRGFMSVEESFEALVGRSTAGLLPTEMIITFIKKAIDDAGRKTIFLDGFPRSVDQIQYSLYFRDLVNYREDPDCMVMINIPLTLIEERLKNRLICPKCNTSRNLKTFPTTKLEYDESEKKFYMLCDNPECEPVRLVTKEGDEKGIEPMMPRMEQDFTLMQRGRQLYGLPIIEIFNAVEVTKQKEVTDDYEITPGYFMKLDESGKAVLDQTPYSFEEDGIEYQSLLAPTTVLQLIKQLDNLFCSSKGE